MSSLSLEKVDHLLWLGRYVERSYTTLTFIMNTYDAALDSVEGKWKGQLEELGFDEATDDPIDFFTECLFSKDNVLSIKNSLGFAYDNAVVLRDVIGTETLAYIQMAVNYLDLAETSNAPMLHVLSVIDAIMAFKGCCDDYIADDMARNILKSGFSLERLDLYTRLGYHLNELPKETRKLASRIDRIGIPYNRESFREFVNVVYREDFPKGITYEELGDMLTLIAKIF